MFCVAEPDDLGCLCCSACRLSASPALRLSESEIGEHAGLDRDQQTQSESLRGTQSSQIVKNASFLWTSVKGGGLDSSPCLTMRVTRCSSPCNLRMEAEIASEERGQTPGQPKLSDTN